MNPIQFTNSTDFDKYPNTLDHDLALLKTENCDIVFTPIKDEFYKSNPLLTMDFGPITSILEGEFRPGHFSGVGIVISKLFNLIKPTKAYFGQKDLQQYYVIKQLITALNFPIKLVCCPIIREKSGLAMSSRNTRLSENGKRIARYKFSRESEREGKK